MMNFLSAIVGGLILLVMMTAFITSAAFSPDILALLCFMVIVFALNGHAGLTIVSGVAAFLLLGAL